MDIIEILTDYRIRLNTLLAVQKVMLLEKLRHKKELLEVKVEINICLSVINNIEGTLNVLKIDSML